MLTWDLFKHYLLSRRAGSVVRIVAWLCITGVCVGVSSLVIVLSVMNGFNGSIKRRLLAVEPHLVISIPGAKTFTEIEQSPAIQYLKSKREVQVDAVEVQDVLLRTVEGNYGGAVAKGVDAKNLANIQRESLRADRSRKATDNNQIDLAEPTLDSSNLGAGEVILGIDLARGLGIFEGDQLTVIAPEGLLLPPGEIPKFEKLLVKGLISTNVPEIDSQVMFFGRGKSLTNLGQAVSRKLIVEARLPDPENFQIIEREIISRGAVVESWAARNSSLLYALRLEKTMIGTFLALSALIASFSMVTVLVLLMTQKRRDIGIFMALGYSSTATRKLFLKLGLLLSAFGFGGGLVLGLIVCFLIQRFPLPILPNIYYDTTIPVRIDPVLIAGVVLISALIALFGAWWPSKTYTNILPSEALRSRGES